MTASKKTAKKTVLPTIPPVQDTAQTVPFSANIVAFNDSTLRAAATLAASIMFSQPQFAAQVNPSNILGLADLFYKYMQGAINVSQPSDATEPTAATFG